MKTLKRKAKRKIKKAVVLPGTFTCRLKVRVRGGVLYLEPFDIVGATNDEKYLTDSTGKRRYWPIKGRS